MPTESYPEVVDLDAMHYHIFALALFAPLIHAAPLSTHFTRSDADMITIRRDVAIIGGGSSGTHAAITLKDPGHIVVVVEFKDRMGGHTETYIDPASGQAVDYGVVVFHNEGLVKKYFARFNISTRLEMSALNTALHSLGTGKAVIAPEFKSDQVAAALEKYTRIVSQWPDLDNGLFLPEPVPEDLTMSFGAFARKHELEAINYQSLKHRGRRPAEHADGRKSQDHRSQSGEAA